MKASEVLEILKSAIDTTRESGVSQVSLDDLQAFATELEKTASLTPADVSAGNAAMEAYKADLSAWVSSRQQNHETDLEMLRSVITTGQSALKSALLINGGAAAAVLAFIGSVWSSPKTTTLLPSLSAALLLFVWGVLSAAAAAGATYLSQAGYGGGVRFKESSRWAFWPCGRSSWRSRRVCAVCSRCLESICRV